MSRKKSKTDEVVVVAQEIAAVVATENPKKKEEKPSERVIEVDPKPVEVPIAKTAPSRYVKVKATTSMKGRYNRYNYEIKAGETYTFPESLAKWLMDLGRVI